MNNSVKTDQLATDFFAGAFQNGPLKVFAILITILCVIFLVSSGYGMIWYERYGSDKKRTLINRLFTSTCWTGIQFYTLIMPVEVVRYVMGPLPEVICSIQLIHKNMITIQAVLFSAGMSFARYLFVFYLKNPSEFMDEFWHIFLNVWVICFAFISQFIFVCLPGSQPLNFYLCVGQNPKKNGGDLSIKKNIVINIIFLMSIVLQVAVAVRFVVHRMKIDAAASSSRKENFRKEICSDILISVFFFIIAFFYGYLVMTVNQLNPADINVYPNYLYVYALHFGYPMFACSLFSALFYAKNEHLRETLWDEIREVMKKQTT